MLHGSARPGQTERERSKDKRVPDHTAVRSQDALHEGRTIVCAERARCVDLVTKPREEDLAITLEVDLLPVV